MPKTTDRKYRLNIVFSAADGKFLRNLAAQERRTLSTWVRMLIEEKTGKILQSSERHYGHTSKIK